MDYGVRLYVRSQSPSLSESRVAHWPVSITNTSISYMQGNKATQVGKKAIRDVAKARGFSVYVNDD